MSEPLALDTSPALVNPQVTILSVGIGGCWLGVRIIIVNCRWLFIVMSHLFFIPQSL